MYDTGGRKHGTLYSSNYGDGMYVRYIRVIYAIPWFGPTCFRTHLLYPGNGTVGRISTSNLVSDKNSTQKHTEVYNRSKLKPIISRYVLVLRGGR